MMVIKQISLTIIGLCAALLAIPALAAENMANPVTGGAKQVTPWCSNGINTYTSGCADTLSKLLVGPRTGYPDPTPSSPGGNVELGFPPSPSIPPFNTTTPTTLSGNFLAGDSITISSLIKDDWTQAFCVQWLTDVFTNNPFKPQPNQNQIIQICQALINTYGKDPYFLQRLSNLNVSYVTKEAGTVKIGTATVYNSSDALKQMLNQLGFTVVANAVPTEVYLSEPVKITYLGLSQIRYCAGKGNMTATNQWANDSSCNYNGTPALAKQYCSHSGNCEITIPSPPPPPPPVPIHPLTVWLTMLGLALTTVFYQRRQHRR